jgi:ATP-binding protein involved in chromosome partitioning
MTPAPTALRKIGDQSFKISWADGKESSYSGYDLRDNCRCAACRNELTGERLLAPGSVPKDIKILKSEIMGNYALGFEFSDGHSTGIYTFDWLYGYSK